MAAFAGFLSGCDDVAPDVERYLTACAAKEAPLYAAYVQADGRVGTLVAPADRLAAALPSARACIVSPLPVREAFSDAPVFAAIARSNPGPEQQAPELDAPLLARIAGVFLRRGLSPEAAASRAIAKFPSGVSALCLLYHKGVPVMLALRRLDPIWLSDNGSSVALIGAPAPPLPIGRNMHPIESGDIAIVEPFQISIVDAEGMRMERRAPRLHNAELAAIAIN